MAEALEIFARKEAALGQNAVICGRHMPLGEHEAVALLHLGLLRVDVQFLEVQIGQDIRRRERAARMPGLRRMDGLDDVLSHTVCRLLQF